MQTKPIYDITPQSLLDFEGGIASILWFAGCPLRCIYCHNPHLMSADGRIGEAEALEFLQSRKGWNDAVVLSGGECCMYDGLLEFCEKIKNMGFLVQVDSSGIRPKTLLELARNSLVDRVCLDFKATKELFERVTGAVAFGLFERSLKGLLRHGTDVRVRTTVYPEYITEEDLSRMSSWLASSGYNGIYKVQKANTGVATYGRLLDSKRGFDIQKVVSPLQTLFIGF